LRVLQWTGRTINDHLSDTPPGQAATDAADRLSGSASSLASTTWVCELTGVGRGGVATVAIRGPAADKCVAACFRPARPAATLTPGQVVYGTWSSANLSATSLAGTPLAAGTSSLPTPAGEAVVVTAVAEQWLEIHCHGGRAAVEAIIGDLIRQGASRCEWSQWLAVDKISPWIIEAHQVLAATTTRRTAAIAYDQTQGALLAAVTDWLRSLTDEQATDEQAADEQQRFAAVRRQIEHVLSFAALGEHLSRPWQIVLAGAPNVGKSSLLNAMLGYRRAITFDAPGTTRDVVSAETVLEGWPVMLSDTAGLRASAEGVERQGVARAQACIDQADLVLLVTDAAQPDPVTPQLETRTPWLWVQNKVDKASGSLAGGIPTVATTGQGVAELFQEIVRCLVPGPPPPGQPMPVTPNQTQALRLAMTACDRTELQAALQKIFDPAR